MALVELHRSQEFLSLDLSYSGCNEGARDFSVALKIAWGIVINAFEPTDRVQFGLVHLEASNHSTRPKLSTCTLKIDRNLPVSQFQREISICQEFGLEQMDTVIVQTTVPGTPSLLDLKALSQKEDVTKVQSSTPDSLM
jgi:hypothetical protein